VRVLALEKPSTTQRSDSVLRQASHHIGGVPEPYKVLNTKYVTGVRISDMHGFARHFGGSPICRVFLPGRLLLLCHPKLRNVLLVGALLPGSRLGAVGGPVALVLSRATPKGI
jgi:hypothetical protein